jgi:hypothetical protein
MRLWSRRHLGFFLTRQKLRTSVTAAILDFFNPPEIANKWGRRRDAQICAITLNRAIP